jgi:Lar family restriction alleviation protein
MEELKRCPFCGGEAIEVRTGESYWVRCSDCDAETALCDSRPDAIAAWNRRVQNIGKKECCVQGEEQ